MYFTFITCPHLFLQVPEKGLDKMPHGKMLRALRILEAALQRFEVPRVTIMEQLKVLFLEALKYYLLV